MRNGAVPEACSTCGGRVDLIKCLASGDARKVRRGSLCSERGTLGTSERDRDKSVLSVLRSDESLADGDPRCNLRLSVQRPLPHGWT